MEKGVKFPEGLEYLLIERALGRETAEKARDGKLSQKELSEITTAMLQLSDWFNGLAPQPAKNYMESKWHRAAYFLYFLPANVIKARTVVAELAGTFCGMDSISALDVGSGPGSLSLGLLDFVARETKIRKLKLTAVDASREALVDWRFLIEGYRDALVAEGIPMEIATHTTRIDITTAAVQEGPWDVIFFGDTINELFRDKPTAVADRARLIARYADNLADGGSVVIIEPALKVTTRALHEVRDLLAREHGFHIYAPCVAGKSCPMMDTGKERDWCHTGAIWARPKIVQRIDQLADRKKLILKFSYCVARRREEYPVQAEPGETAFRLTGDIIAEKGKFHGLFCGLPGCAKMTLLARDVNENTAEFPELCRGDIVAIDTWEERGDGLRLTGESKIRLLRKFS